MAKTCVTSPPIVIEYNKKKRSSAAQHAKLVQQMFVNYGNESEKAMKKAEESARA